MDNYFEDETFDVKRIYDLKTFSSLEFLGYKFIECEFSQCDFRKLLSCFFRYPQLNIKKN